MTWCTLWCPSTSFSSIPPHFQSPLKLNTPQMRLPDSNTHQNSAIHIRKKSKFSKIFNFSECHHKVLKWSPLSVFEPGNGFYLKFFAFLLGVASSGARARPHEAEPNRRFEEKSKNTHTPLGNLNEKIRKRENF